MNQSGFIAGCLLAAFVLYVAAKGRLTTYTDVLWGPTNAALPPFLGIPLLSVSGTAAAAGGSAADSLAGGDAAKIGSSDIFAQLGADLPELLALAG